MIVKLRLEQTNLLEGRTEILAEGKAILSGSTLTFAEKKPFEGKGRIEFSDEGLTLIHEGETSSRTELHTGRKGTARVCSPFGDMAFETVLLAYEITPETVTAQYELWQEKTRIGHFRMRAEYDSLPVEFLS